MIAKDVDIPGVVRQAKTAVVQIVALDDQNKTLKTGTGFSFPQTVICLPITTSFPTLDLY
jgi:hypothetical protein